MSEIKAGDWFRVFKPSSCCNSFASMNMVFQIIGQAPKFTYICDGCGKEKPVGAFLVELDDSSIIEFSRLKKIPPLNELEDQTEERKVKV